MKVIMVDENDNPIGVKERDTWGADEMHRVSVLWISNSKGEVLLAQRALLKKHAPGKWGPAAAGTVEEGETYETNVIKETEEEIGLTLTIDQLEEGPKELVGKPGNRRFRKWYMIKRDIPLDTLTLQEDEVMAVKWMHYTELEADLAAGAEDYIGFAQESFLPLIEWTKGTLAS